MAQGIGKDVILVTNNIKTVPSNLQGLDFCVFPQDIVVSGGKLWMLLCNLRTKVASFHEIEAICDALEFQKHSIKVENLLGERMFVSNFIPSMAREVDLEYKDARKIYPFGDEPVYLKEYVDCINKRRKFFGQKLRGFKCREIYSLPSLRKYASTRMVAPCTKKDPKNEAKLRIQTLINRLRQFPKTYSIGLSEEDILYKFLLKKGSCVITDTPARRISKDAGGTLSIVRSFVNRYEELFEELWKGIPRKWKNKEKVTRELRKLLKQVK